MSRSTDLQKYFDSVKRRDLRLDGENAYRVPELRASDRNVMTLKMELEATGEDDNHEAKTLLEMAEKEFDEILEAFPPVEFVFTKLSRDTYSRVMRHYQSELNAAIRRLVEEDGPIIRQNILEAIRNDQLIAGELKPGEPNDEVERHIKAALVTQIMQMEGSTEEAASVVSDFDPEIEFLDHEKKMLEVADTLPADEYATALIQSEKTREKLIDKKKKALIARRIDEIKKRKEDLESKTIEDLVGSLVNIQVLEEATDRARVARTDWEIFYEARDPKRPIKKNAVETDVVVGYEGKFENISEVVTIRENDDDFYAYLLAAHQHLNGINSAAEIEALADYDPFRGNV